MSRIPPDVERLMWLVAESNEPQAVHDFEQRFPQYVAELGKRRRMVTDLKGAKATTHHVPHTIPAFTPRTVQSTRPSSAVWVVGGIAATALAFASYSVGVWVTKEPPKLPPVEQVQTVPPSMPETNVYVPPTVPKPNPVRNDPVPTQPNVVVPPQNLEPPKTLKLSNTSLEAALKMIGQMAGYNVQVAPGFVDQQVSIDYTDTTTSEMLRDLGMRYGFTPFDQGDGTLIIVPAVDRNAPVGDPNGSDRRIGG